MNKNFLKLFFLIIILVFSFIFKGFNYKYSFTIDQTPSVIFDHLSKWNGIKGEKSSFIDEFQNYESKTIHKKIKVKDSIFNLKWKLKQIGDYNTKVIIYAKDELNFLKQNFLVVNNNNHFRQQSEKYVKEFAKSLIQNKKNYFLSEIEITDFPNQFSAYIELESKKEDKAKLMRENIHKVMYYIEDNNIDMIAAPFVEVTNWNFKNDLIKFNFSFPIVERNFQKNNKVKFSKTPQQKALKIVFNGNYKISDIAWLTLVDYANYNNIPVKLKPIEIYLDDPHGGGNDLEWEANVYLPLKN